MPLYEFECKTCKAQDEVIQKHSAPAPKCPKEPEHGPMVKRISLSTFELKGKRWASDGYA